MKFLIFIMLMTPTTYLLADCDVENHFQQPTPAGHRALLKEGSQCLPELIQFYNKSTDENIRFEILVLILATGSDNQETTELFTGILGSDSSVKPEKILLDYKSLTETPDDQTLQDNIISYLNSSENHGWHKFPFQIFGLDSLFVFESMSLRIEDFNEDALNAFGHALKLHFKVESNDILLSTIQRIYEQALLSETDEARTLSEKLSALIAHLDVDFKVELMSWLLNKSEYPLNYENANVLSLISACLEKDVRYLDSEITEKISLFFFNSYTASKTGEESDRDWEFRRIRLLEFWNILKTMEYHGKAKRHLILQFLEPNIEAIGSSDMVEFTTATAHLIARMEEPNRLILKLLDTNKPKMVAYAFQIIRLIPSEHWENQENETEGILQRVAQFSVYSFSSKPTPEDIRLSAAATLQFMKPQLDSSMDSVLSGLAESDPDLRVETLYLLSESKITSRKVADHLARTLRKDPDIKVKLAAMTIINAQLELASEAREDHIFYDSLGLGMAILYTWNFADEEFLQIAEPALEKYVKKSPHSGTILKAGLRTNIAKIQEISAQMLSIHIGHKLSETSRLMASYSAQENGVRLDSDLSSSLATHFSRVIELISKIRTDTEQNEQQKIYAMGDLLINYNYMLKELKKIADTSDSEDSRQLAREILSRLTEANNS